MFISSTCYFLTSGFSCRIEIFNAPVMHSTVPDFDTRYTGAEIKTQFGVNQLLDGTTMDYIIDEVRNTSDLYATGERVLLSQGFIMVRIAVYNVCCTITMIILCTDY
jgi:hypothetical protein